MRFDFLIIYSHGIPHLREIMSVVRDFPSIQIDFIKRFNALEVRPSMTEFVEGLYACDHVPIDHLRGKTAYLSSLSPEFVFVLLKNLAPDERMFGEGEFAHIQCSRIKQLKEVIRNRWNPYEGQKRTENHVIHGSDYESQVEHVLSYFGLPPISHFNRPTDYNLRYFVELEKWEIRKIPISKIICRTAFEESTVENGIWLKYVQGDKQPYTDYIERVIGVKDFDDHYAEAFDRLIDGFAYRDLIAVRETAQGFKMIDGNHRAAIVRSWGENEIVAVVEKMRHDASWLKKVLADCVVIRRKKYFPEYYAGEDIDLICFDPGKVAKAVKKKRDCTISETAKGIHVDFMDGDKIHLRLDLVSSLLPNDTAYLNEVLERSEKVKGWRVPCPTDEIILRGIEYCQHPEKKWHFEFIQKA